MCATIREGGLPVGSCRFWLRQTSRGSFNDGEAFDFDGAAKHDSGG
jgi:hypothetical protein